MLMAKINGGAHPVLVLRGSIAGGDLIEFSDALERAARDSPDGLLLDLTDLEDWSLLAQAVVLRTARRLAADGRELVLCNPNERLRTASSQLDIFARVATRDDPHST